MAKVLSKCLWISTNIFKSPQALYLQIFVEMQFLKISTAGPGLGHPNRSQKHSNRFGALWVVWMHRYFLSLNIFLKCRYITPTFTIPMCLSSHFLQSLLYHYKLQIPNNPPDSLFPAHASTNTLHPYSSTSVTVSSF